MKEKEILNIIDLGEDSKTQFKENIHSPDSLAQEMVAFSNAGGGIILVGVQDNGRIKGLKVDDIHRLNQMVSNVSSNNIEPPINPLTETIKVKIGTGILRAYRAYPDIELKNDVELDQFKVIIYRVNTMNL